MKKLIIIIASVSILSGCATIVDGAKEDIAVDTSPAEGAKCAVKNSKGEWYIDKTPGSVAVHRAYGPLEVDCKKDGYDEAKMTVKSHTKVATFGNVLVGGAIGVGVDCASGSAYDYPQKIIVPMKKLSA